MLSHCSPPPSGGAQLSIRSEDEGRRTQDGPRTQNQEPRTERYIDQKSALVCGFAARNVEDDEGEHGVVARDRGGRFSENRRRRGGGGGPLFLVGQIGRAAGRGRGESSVG